jgi:uncharacterized membrane protein
MQIAVAIEFIGAVIIASSAVRAARALVRCPMPDRARYIVASGAIAGLDFKMGATLLKALSLPDWPQIGKFSVILVLRAVLKLVLKEMRNF